jgi:hypothetical protein
MTELSERVCSGCGENRPALLPPHSMKAMCDVMGIAHQRFVTEDQRPFDQPMNEKLMSTRIDVRNAVNGRS